MNTMTVEGVQYVEAPIIKACAGCAFYHRDSCLDIGHAAREAFGESCVYRKVIHYAPESATAREPVSIPYKLRLRDFTGF